MFKDIIDFIRTEFSEKEKFIPLHEPKFIGNDRKYVIDAIDSTFVSSVGKYVDQFEKMICDYTGSKYAVATVNGTSALHMALILAGVKKDDLVITQPLSFIATCNAITYINASPLFVDINEHTLGMCASKLEDFFNEKTHIRNEQCFHKESGKRIGACVPMHTFGHPVEIDKIADICQRNKVVLVEDAAESMGSKFKGKHTGTYGLLGVFSFNGNKTITCGGGGVIVTNDEEIAKTGNHLTTQAKKPHAWEFDHDYIGYNYRMPNINAALACAQMEELDVFIRAKRKLANTYKEYFATTPYTHISEPVNSYSNYWLNVLLLQNRDERDSFLEYSNANKVMARPAWQLMSRVKMFKDCICENITTAEYISDRLVNIPSSPILKT